MDQPAWILASRKLRLAPTEEVAMEPVDDDMEIFPFTAWAVPVEESRGDSSDNPRWRIWSGPDDAAMLFRLDPDNEQLPPNGSFVRLRKRGDAA